METIIQIQHLQKHFGNLKVLNDVDFDIHKGEVVTIIGSSGIGILLRYHRLSVIMRIMSKVIREWGGPRMDDWFTLRDGAG